MSITRTALDTSIDANITDKTAPNSISAADEGNQMKLVADYVDTHPCVSSAIDTNASTNHVTVQSGLTLISYTLTTWRQGNTCHANILLSVSADASARTIANITNPDFECLSDIYMPLSGIQQAIVIENDGRIRTSNLIAQGDYVGYVAYPAKN